MSEEIRDILPEDPEVKDPSMENPEIPEVPTDPSEEEEPIENPEVPELPTPDEDEMTIKEYLQGVSELLSEKALRNILVKRKLWSGTSVKDLTERELDLAEAEVYYNLSNLPVGGQQVKDVDGSWSHSEGGWTVSKANIDEWYRKYVALRQKWGESVLKKSTIKVHPRGMRVWRRR